MVGIRETKEALVFGLELASALKKALADGEISLKDVSLVFPLARMAPDAIEGLQKIPGELKDLSAAELEELHALAKPYFKELAGEQLTAAIGQAIELAIKVGKLVGVLA